MAEDKFDKTEQATPRKLEQSREKGEVAKSKDATSVVMLLGSIGIFYFFSDNIIENISSLVRDLFAESATVELTVANAQGLLLKISKGILYIMMPFLLLPLIGLVANFLQIGFIFSLTPITPKLSKVNPLSGLKRLFGAAAGMEFLKSLAKMVIVGFVAFSVLKDEVQNFGELADTETMTMFMYLGTISFKVLVRSAWVLVVIALIDFIFQKWEKNRNMKMSKHEIKEEYKDTEGQPLVKARIRSLQRSLAKQRMMQEVPEATVVITNPTHFSVALKYEQGTMSAPVVVAKGAGVAAKKIREIAKENGVPLVENKPLARALWKLVEVGSEVPENLYQAIAEVLAYVFKLKKGIA